MSNRLERSIELYDYAVAKGNGNGPCVIFPEKTKIGHGYGYRWHLGASRIHDLEVTYFNDNNILVKGGVHNRPFKEKMNAGRYMELCDCLFIE